MTNQDLANLISAALATAQGDVAGLQAALTVLQNGFTSDNATITTLQAQIAAALACAQDQTQPNDTTRLSNTLAALQ
jgi:hypothetical protein